MNLKHYFWYFQKAVPERLCDAIVKYALTHQPVAAVTGDFKNFNTLNWQQKKDLNKQRDSNVVWLTDPWIYNEIAPFVRKANSNAGWNFQIDCAEQCQFTTYEKDQFYTWHCDGWPEEYKSIDKLNGKIRKLSVTLSLSDPDSYRGGELEFSFNTNPHLRPRTAICHQILPKGSLVVFPSFVWHRVTPVTEGKRYSLVVWNCGNNFI
jgi:PKHD-type hydroxylase